MKIWQNIKKSQNIINMILLTATIVKNNDIYTRIYFIFLKLVLEQTSKSFNTKFRT